MKSGTAKRPETKPNREEIGLTKWILGRLNFCLVLGLAVQLWSAETLAAETLNVDLKITTLRARSQSPIPVAARFEWDSKRILEGQLQVELHEGNRILGRYRSGDLALTSGDQQFRMLFPPMLTPFADPQVEVQMKFISAGNAIDLEPSLFSLPLTGERSLVVGWCDSGAQGDDLSADLVRNLRFERFAPPSDTRSSTYLMTSVTRLIPEDLPAQPLQYAAFDLMVLTTEAFKAAGERQLQALERWVQGGGSVCVFVGGGLQPHHLQFLNQLAPSTPDSPAFLADNSGNLLSPPKAPLSFHTGVGRSVIVPETTAAELNWTTPAGRNATAFLWKMRRSQVRAMTDLGHWEPATNAPQTGVFIPGAQFRRNNVVVVRGPQPGGGMFTLGGPMYRNNRLITGPMSYSVQPNDVGNELMNLLLPKTVRLIPFSALCVLLGLFVLMIGPGDYFVLGFFRRRRLTWVLFPATSIAFTVATVLMANHYLGLRDQRRSLIVVDLASDGTALRWNRYEMVFAARDKQSLFELKDALWAPLDVQGAPFYNPNAPGYGYSGRGDAEANSVLYAGTLPVHYQVGQSLRQWRPELGRTFSFEPPPVPLFSNWPAIESAWPNLANMRARLAETKSFSGDLYKINGPGSSVASPGSTGLLPMELLEELCAGNATGLQTLVSQISPTGGGNFEDLSAMDTEAHDSALAIVTRVGDDIVLYRRFFYGK